MDQTIPNPDTFEPLASMAENRRMQMELARMRAMATRAPSSSNAPILYNRQTGDSLHEIGAAAWKPPLDRRTSQFWKPFSDRVKNVEFESDGTLRDPLLFAAEAGPFKVRWLRGPQIGAVEDIGPVVYFFIRGSTQAEPVPDDEPLCPPARPANMPSDFNKARAMVAKARKLTAEQAESLTFLQCAAYFTEKARKAA